VPHADPAGAGALRWALVAAGPLAAAAALALAPASLPPAATRTLAVGAWMAAWWILEPLPLAATSLLPLVLFPLLGIASLRDTAAPYAHDIVYLFLAGLLLAAALERWGVHRRLALGLVRRAGASGRGLLLAVMAATALISMWLSNTATAALMLPIIVAIGGTLGEGEGPRQARTALVLGMAYAASLGGMGTLVGTPPNLVMAGAVRTVTGQPLDFGRYLLVGVPIVLVLVPLAWALLALVLFPRAAGLGADARATLDGEVRALGPLRGGEATVLAIFAAVALGWVAREPKDLGIVRIPGLTDLLPALGDATIGLAGALLCFALTGRRRDGSRVPLLTWAEARRIPWEVLLFFGGGLSLAAAVESSGLAAAMVAALGGLAHLPPLALELLLAVAMVAVGEFASNVALAAAVLPLAGALARAAGMEPLPLLLLTGLSASLGFALPVATPPNAIAYASGLIRARDMLRAGLLLDLLGVVVLVGLLRLLAPLAR